MGQKKIKVAFLIRSLEYGGAERQLVTLAKGIDKECFEVAVFYFYSGGSLERELQNGQIKMICLEKRNRWDMFGFFSRLISDLKEFNPDILHGYLSTSNLIALGLKPFFPKTRIIWGVRASNLDLSKYDWFARLNFQLECLLSQFADRIIVNSHTGRDYHIQHGFPKQNITVIPNGIDTNLFSPNIQLRERTRLEWNLQYDDMILIGLVGRIDPIKDHFTFFNAAALLLKQHQNVRFVCVGSGEENYEKNLKDFVRNLGIDDRVIWLGMRNDMPAIYNSLDIVTSCSLSEGFSNAIAEAMSCDVPCVVTDVGDSAWLVNNTGFVVPIQQPEEIVAGWLSCLDKILQEERFRQNNSVRKRILENFSVEKLVEKTQNIFKEVIV